jgi:hypothetical protein
MSPCRWVLTFRRNILFPSSKTKTETLCFFEMLVPTYKTIRRHIPEYKNLHSHPREKVLPFCPEDGGSRFSKYLSHSTTSDLATRCLTSALGPGLLRHVTAPLRATCVHGFAVRLCRAKIQGQRLQISSNLGLLVNILSALSLFYISTDVQKQFWTINGIFLFGGLFKGAVSR